MVPTENKWGTETEGTLGAGRGATEDRKDRDEWTRQQERLILLLMVVMILIDGVPDTV